MAGDKPFLVNLIETYLPAEALFPAEEEIMQALMDVELSWQERIEAKSRVEGRVEGKRELLLYLIKNKFKELPDDLVERIQLIKDDATLDAIAEQILSASSLAELQIPHAGESI